MIWPFFNKNKSSTKIYLGILLKQDEALLMLLKNENNLVQYIDSERVLFTNSWETLTEDIDASLSVLEKRNNVQVQDTIFYVYTSLIDQNTRSVQKYYLDKIKSIVKNLDLKALGFIECYEGISTYLQKKEELPLTATIIELDVKAVSVFIYKGGKSIFYQMVSRTDDIVQDLISIFAGAKEHYLLPSRCVLYGIGDISEEVSSILSHKWAEEIFIHSPKIDLIKKEDFLESLVYIFGKEINTPAESSDVPLIPSPASPIVEAVPTIPAAEEEVLGFKINQDISATTPAASIPVLTMDDLPNSKKSKKPFALPSFSIKSFMSPRIVPIWGIIFIVIGIILNELLLHKAEVTLIFPSEKLSKDIKVDVAVGGGKELNVYVSTDSAEFTASSATTGKKDIGEASKGEVTIHNFDDKEKIFLKGTQLETDGVKFVLDEEIKVASASLASDGSAKLPGKVKANLTASAIGTEGNIAKGKKFSIADLSNSTYFGMNDNAFSGGTKKTVNVVSKKDLDGLRTKLLDKAEEGSRNMNPEAKEKGNIILPDLEKKSLDKISFSKDADDEASNVTAKGNVIWTAYYLKEDELKAYIVSELAKEIEGNKTLQKEKLAYEIKEVKKIGNDVEIELTAKGSSVKEINTDNVVNDLPLKNVSKLDVLKEKYGVSDYKVKSQQPLFFFNQFLPPFKKNITIKISYL